MMQTARIRFAERLGGALGRLWKRCVRLDRKVCSWLVARGLPTGLAEAMLWIIKLVVLGVLFYVAFGVAFLFLLGAAAARAARNAEWEEEQPEWRNGVFGFGLYHSDGSRIDPHDPDDEL